MAQIMAFCEPPPDVYRAIDAALEKCRLKEEAEKARSRRGGTGRGNRGRRSSGAEARRILDEQTAPFQADLAACLGSKPAKPKLYLLK